LTREIGSDKFTLKYVGRLLKINNNKITEALGEGIMGKNLTFFGLTKLDWTIFPLLEERMLPWGDAKGTAKQG